MIPYGRQHIDADDLAAVRDVLLSDWLTQGPKVVEFEQAVADKLGARHAVAMANATSSLHAACLALGLGPGDLLWTTPNTFVASANCARYCGAEVDFVDIDPRTYNLSPEELRRKLTEADRKGRVPKVLIVVHHSGQPCDMREIGSIAQQFDVRVIEDASHAIGARYRGEYIGGCRYSDVVVFSLHPVKIITTGEGGLALTNQEELARKMELARSHGITRDPLSMESEPDGPWYYEQIGLGFNYRMTDIQAALGLSQLRRLDEFIELRKQLAARYDAMIAGLPFITPWQHPAGESARHLYVVRLDTSRMCLTRRHVFESMRRLGIGVNVHYIPVHTQPYYRRLGFAAGDFPESERYYAEAMSIPLYAAMTNGQQDEVVRALQIATKEP